MTKADYIRHLDNQGLALYLSCLCEKVLNLSVAQTVDFPAFLADEEEWERYLLTEDKFTVGLFNNSSGGSNDKTT